MRVTPGVWRRLARFWAGSAQMQRWVAFNLVGVLGILIQLSTLAVLTGWLGLHYLLATGLAVELVVLHNFVWHERWTWSDRSRKDKEGVWRRLVRFHFANGALSIAGNIILMRFFAGTLSMNYTVANALSIAVCSILNFFASDRLVFQGSHRESGESGFALHPPRLRPTRRLHPEAQEAGLPELPSWQGVKQLEPHASEKYQRCAAEVARK